MRLCLIILLISFMSLPVQAEEISEEKPAVCKIAVQHKPASDVAYQPGVDASGNAVVPADLNAAPFKTPEIIKVPLSVDLAQRMNSLGNKGINMEAPLGMLEIHQDGTIRYNDQDWTAPVLTLCGESHKQTENAEVPPAPIKKAIKEQDRQSEPNTINSPDNKNGTEFIDRIEAGMVSKAVEVSPTEAVPPKQISKEPEIIHGGEYKDYDYNE